MALHLGIGTKQQLGQDFTGAFAGLIAHGPVRITGKLYPYVLCCDWVGTEKILHVNGRGVPIVGVVTAREFLEDDLALVGVGLDKWT
jgi:hypothetical protein